MPAWISGGGLSDLSEYEKSILKPSYVTLLQIRIKKGIDSQLPIHPRGEMETKSYE